MEQHPTYKAHLAALDIALDLEMDKMKLTLLIGSFARGTGDLHSDIDILRVGHTQSVMRPENIDWRLPMSYVDYDSESFSKLYDEGSLFLYHALFEGKLISGDEIKWRKLKKHFIISSDFRNSILEYLDVLTYIDEYPDYENSYVPYLSNIFKCLKNVGIFKLASKKYYNFEKIAALKLGCGLTDSVARTLILANAVFERSTPISTQLMNNFQNSATEWRFRLRDQIGELAHDI